MSARFSRRSISAVPVLLVAGLGLACGPMSLDEAPPPTCQGKCDGLSQTFKDFFSDMTKVDLGDLVNIGAKLATEQINNQLDNIPYANIELEPTALYALSAKAQSDLTLKDIESLTAGLAARYGDGAFVTRINKLRVDYLQQHPDRVFAEASFELGAALAPHLSFKAGGLPGQVGFLGSKGVRTSVVAPVKELSGVVSAPVKALTALRGFVLPRDLKDMQQMTPGESVSLQSEGTVGFNIGVGLPIYITTIASYATIHAVFSAGARATLTGLLDIQLIREDGDTVVVDVGVTDQTAHSMNVGVKSKWGIEGLPSFKLKVGSLDLDATALAENALEDLLDKRLALFEAGYVAGKDHTRHTVARFSFDLARQNQAMEQAIVQALKGDIRLAQSLAHRKTPGVAQLLDLSRDTKTLSSYFGVNVLSLSFFSQKKDTTGSAVITVGPNSQQLLFDEIDRQKGAFTSQEGYKRRTVVSLKSVDGKLVDADFNLQVQMRDKGSHGGVGQILGHVDPLLSLFIGKDRLVKRLEPATRSIRYYIKHKCPEPMDEQDFSAKLDHEKCLKSLTGDPQVAAARAKAAALFATLVSEGIQGGLDAQYDDAETFANKLFELKLAVQSNTANPDEPWDTPKTNLVFDYRLTDKAVTSLLAAPDGEKRFVQALYDVLAILDPSFEGQLGVKPPWDYNPWDNDQITPTCVVLKDVMDRVTPVFTKYAGRYQRYANLSTESYTSTAMGKTTLGESAHLLVVEGKDKMSLASIAEGKAENTAKLFDKLVDKLGWTSDFFETAHEVIGYTLLTAMHPSETELLVNFDFKKSGDADFPDVRLYGRGAQAKLIDAGQYSLDALMGQ